MRKVGTINPNETVVNITAKAVRGLKNIRNYEKQCWMQHEFLSRL